MGKKATVIYLNSKIYILSDEEIKKGDWIFDTVTNTIQKAKYSNGILERDFRKIIATTDESLGIAKISDSFVQKYIEKSKTDTPIKNVQLGYNECRAMLGVDIDDNLNISDVINQRELLISFLTWVREDCREDISIEYLVDYWLDKRNQ